MTHRPLIGRLNYFITGILFLFIGILCNELLLARVFSVDGYIIFANKVIIRTFELALVIWGAIFIFLHFKVPDNNRSDASSRVYNVFIPALWLFNLGWLLFFFYQRWYPAFGLHREMAFVAFFLIMIIGFTALSLKLSGLKPLALLFHTSHFLLILILTLSEIIFFLIPSVIPAPLILNNPGLAHSFKENREIVDYLPESPWIRFKPLTKIKLRELRGDDLINEWVTDQHGFKNLPEIAARNDIKILAIGDSNVEGFGLGIQDTWTSLLNKEEIPTYNLGVQGYAPVQITGTLRQWGGMFSPDFVIFGYTPGFEDRELHFVNLKRALKQKRFTGGIDMISQFESEDDRNIWNYNVLNTIFDATKIAFKKKVLNLKNPLGPHSIFYPYYVETVFPLKKRFYEDTMAAELTKEAILNAKKLSDSMDARLIVLFFAQRRIVFHQYITGKEAPKDLYDMKVIAAMKNFCADNGIETIDINPAYIEYVKQVVKHDQETNWTLPFFRQDGHSNKFGQQIIAQEVYKYIKEYPQLSKKEK